MKVLIVTSASSETHMTQSSIIYLASLFNRMGMEFKIKDLSGMIDYFNPPDEFFSPWLSEQWLNKDVFYSEWLIDNYLKDIDEEVDIVCYSALFSTDVLIHARHSVIMKDKFPNCYTVIGGAAVTSFNNEQLSVLNNIFDFIYTGDLLKEFDITLDYSLTPIKPFVTIYSGQGCLYSKCRFCNNSGSCSTNYYLREINDIVEEFCELEKYNVADVMLSSDMFPHNYMVGLAKELIDRNIDIPYNVMLRAEKWVDSKFSILLKRSRCTDVFVGAEAFNNNILKVLNKGTNVDNNTNTIKNLCEAGINVEIGLILFIPKITKSQLDEQLEVIEKVLPYVNSVNLEILTITNNSEFSLFPEKYGIELWPASGKSIIPSWCYGFSSDIPWTFRDINDIQLWLDHYNDLKLLLGDLVSVCYYESVNYLRNEFLEV